jgi:hypothetical protein
MFELLADALKALAGYPPLAAFGGFAVIIGGGVWLLLRAERDRKINGNGQTIPSWALYGPVKDVMGAVHEMNEQSRESNRILVRIEELSKDMSKEQREQTMLLEDIRNNQLQRSESTMAHPPRRKP